MARATRGLETRSSRADSVNRSVNQTPRNGLRREDAAGLTATRAVCTPRSAWPPETARDARRMAHNPAMHDPVSESRQSRVVLLAARLSRPSPPCQGQAARGRFASLDPASSARGWQLSRRTGGTRARPSAQAGRRFAGPLTPATSGLSRSLADSPSRRSGRPTGPDGTDSEADSAGSIPVTRSSLKAQVSPALHGSLVILRVPDFDQPGH